MVIEMIAFAVGLAVLLAEWLHARRTRRLAWLAFGPRARPRGWVLATIPLRAAAAAALCWGLLVLLSIDAQSPEDRDAAPQSDKHVRHVVLLLDVSPSMHIADSGTDGRQPRDTRARDVLRSVLARLDSPAVRTTVVAFYTEARPVVVDTFDPEVTANILDDLPLEHAFAPGKTNLYTAVKSAAKIGAAWPERSAVLVLVSDGDTLPATETPTLPPAFERALVVGVGNSRQGTFIDGHSSRQDVESLRRLAARLKGTYHDGNARHVPTAEVSRLAPVVASRGTELGRRAAALAAVAAGACLLAGIPVLLALAGGTWPPPPQRVQSIVESQPRRQLVHA